MPRPAQPPEVHPLGLWAELKAALLCAWRRLVETLRALWTLLTGNW